MRIASPRACAVRPAPRLTAHDVLVCRHRWLLETLRAAEQIVWATFFFCRTKACCTSIRSYETYADSARKASFVLRVVDATYVTLLAPTRTAKPWLATFPSARWCQGPLEQMTFPE
jgi:hypothetical protein